MSSTGPVRAFWSCDNLGTASPQLLSSLLSGCSKPLHHGHIHQLQNPASQHSDSTQGAQVVAQKSFVVLLQAWRTRLNMWEFDKLERVFKIVSI